MTDRYAGLLVTLKDDVRSDDAEPLISAIRQLRNVVDVQPVVAGVEHHTARCQVRAEFMDKIFAALREL